MYKREQIFGVIGGSVLILFLLAGIAWGSGDSNPRAVGMGGAYTAMARDLEAPYWNPANLGLSDGKAFTINLFNVGAGIKNNSFSLSDYNKYNGQFLDDAGKEEFLGHIPADGLSLDLKAEVSALNFSAGNFALTSRGYAVSSLNLDRDPFELLFYGNAIMDNISFSDTRGESYGIADMGLSYGHPLMVWKGGEFAVGASLHYLRGLGYEKVTNAEGGVATTDSGFVGSGNMAIRTALGGSGYSADLGLAVRFEENWYFSAAWQNFYSKLNWSNETEEIQFTFNMEPITIQGLSDSTVSDSLVTSSDTTIAIPSFSSDLPAVIKLGLVKNFRKLTCSLDWEQATKDRPGFGLNPRVSAGLEYRPAGFFPLRVGMGTGGKQGSIYSFGFGLHLGAYHFDIGMANTGSPLPSHTKGAKFAIGMGLYF